MVATRATLRGGVCSLQHDGDLLADLELFEAKLLDGRRDNRDLNDHSVFVGGGPGEMQDAASGAVCEQASAAHVHPDAVADGNAEDCLFLGGNVSWRSRNPAGDRQAADARGEARLRVEADCFSEEPVVGGQHEAVEVVLAVGDDGHRRAGSFAANGIVGVMSDAGVGVHDAGLRVFAEDDAGSGLPTGHGAGVGIGVQVLGKALRILRRILFSLLIRQKTMKRLSRVILAAS